LTAGRDIGLPLRVRVLQTPAVNAITLPGGQIFVLSGLIDEAKGSGELAGVLAHEIGQVERRHPIEAAFKSIGFAALLSFVVGDVSGGTFIVAGSQALIESAFSRDAEREADESALDMLNRTGMSAAPMADFFDRLTDMEPDADSAFAMISTHPPSAERAAAIRAASTGDGSAMSAADWQAIRAICEE
ncbi:MAG: M48 family metallopeptidase, partial [Alphaproteobacteria bacterium]